MLKNNSENSGTTAEWSAALNLWKAQELAENKERVRKEAARQLEENVGKYAAALQKKASRRGSIQETGTYTLDTIITWRNSGATAEWDAALSHWKAQKLAEKEEREIKEAAQQLEEHVKKYAAALQEKPSRRGSIQEISTYTLDTIMMWRNSGASAEWDTVRSLSKEQEREEKREHLQEEEPRQLEEHVTEYAAALREQASSSGSIQRIGTYMPDTITTWENNGGNSEATAESDAAQSLLEAQELAEEEERMKQRAERKLDKRLRQYAAAFLEQASWRGTLNRPKF